MASCWDSFTSALSPVSMMRSQRDATLQEQLLSLRERADALRHEHDEAVRETASAEAATLDAEMREREAVADRRVAVMTKEKHEKELPVLIKELKVKDERVRVLLAILDTVERNKKPVYL